ncbi:iron transporter [Deinococcus humi]|uniref:Fe2+ transport protein n=1 Tax=Deinococcus humi TaxID=662880 RepID=A0A7W8JVQ0_9DEIO|nr:iron transporter [Deinococcus humi]MBB5363850.1 hypothetical protein [Deinococcus humi]GGO31757.1 hypothetical protein GCM10008949_28230 [Deinococcus humi]
MTTPDHKMTPSEEADANQLKLARREGDAYQEALKYMANDVADSGQLQRSGDYIIGYAQEKAEGMYELRGEGQLEWMEPTDENCHLEISVSDASDGRFLPYIKVYATLTGQGETVGPFEVPFLWHPGLYHYGKNIRVPGDGEYDLRVRIEAPTFMRHDKQNGERYAAGAEVTFKNIPVKTGQG